MPSENIGELAMDLMDSLDNEAREEGHTLVVENAVVVIGYRVEDENGEVVDAPIRYAGNCGRPYITAGLLDYAATYIRHRAGRA